MPDFLRAAGAVDARIRETVRVGLKGIYTDKKDAVLTFRQRDCVVQYICEVRPT